MTDEERQKIDDEQIADKARRELIFNKVRDFDVFLRTTQFGKEEIALLSKTFDIWAHGIRHAKKVE